jgi:phosphoribosylanthranilate isomerase
MIMVKVKFCGIRRREDILCVNDLKPDYTGFVFAKSKRQVSPETAASLRSELISGIKAVGVFVNEPLETIAKITREVGLDIVQLHGEEDSTFAKALKTALPKTEIWKAVRAADMQAILAAEDYPADRLLFDAFSKAGRGGTGETADWDLLRSCRDLIKRPFFLAGGLNAANIDHAVSCVDPYGVDLSSGIETDGFKDPEKMREILSIVRR